MARQINLMNVLYIVTAILKFCAAVSPSLSVFGVSIFVLSSVSYDTTVEGMLTQEIKIKQGRLVGQRLQSRSNPDLKAVEVYLGIPYAAPPTGSQRFMPPGSPPQWRGVKLADTFGPVCPQHLPDLNKRTKNAMSEGRVKYLTRLFPYLQHNQSEDCLYLNIYAPAQKRVSGRSNPKYPVIVFIHGESFEWNSGNPYDGSVLASYGEVVVVTLNFRLGILGFLRPGAGDHTVSNFGLLDQIAALQWIKENIQEFGGDPGSVTLMGHGTGAACVHYLMVSPVSRGTEASGLFHRAILMSGTALADWALTTSSVVAIQVSHALNCPLTETNNEMATCLRKRRLDEIMDVKVVVPEFKTRFGPMVDGNVVPNDPFNLTAVYKDLFSRYDLLYGLTEVESYDLLDALSLQHGMLEQDRDKKIRTYVRERFEYEPGLILAETLKAYNVASRQSIDSSNSVAETHRDILLDILSDARAAAPMVQTANFHSTANPKSYFYVFSHKSEYGDYGGVKIQKSIHGEELPYVFGVPLDSVKFPSHHHFTEMEKLLSEAVMTFWTNFAKTGNPNVPRTERYWMKDEIHWPEYDVFNQSYLILEIPLKIGQHYRQEILDYWINYGSNLSSKYIGFLRDEKGCLNPNDTGFIEVEEADTGSTTSLPKILLIVFGICSLVIIICAYGALYNQRRKLRAQELFIRNFYSEAEIANSKVMYVEHGSGGHEPENLTAVGTVRKKCTNKEMLHSNCEGQYGGERKGTAEDIKRGDSETSRRKISRECSASTMDTNTKVRRWIDYELNQRSSPELRSLNPTPFEAADQENVPTSSKFHSPADDPSPVLVIPVIHKKQNPSCSTTCKQISTIRPVPRKVAKKVSVAVDATPSARIASMLCIHVKDTSGDASIQTAQGTMGPKEAVPLGPECCDANSTLVPAIVSEGEPSNCRQFESFHLEKYAVSQANPVVTDVKNVSSHSRSVTHHNTSKVEPSDMTNKTVNESPMEICPKKNKLHGTKKDVGINTKPDESVLERMENAKCVTLKDTAADTNEILPVFNSLQNSYRRNETELLSSEQNVVNEHEEQTGCGKGATLIGTLARRKSSVPFHMYRRPSRLRQSAIKRINRDNKTTCPSRRGNPSTVVRPKPNIATPRGILQDSFEATSPTAALPTDVNEVPIAGHPSTLIRLPREPNNTQSSVVIVEKQIVDKQNQLRQDLPSAALSPTKLRATEAQTEKLPLPKAVFCKKRSPAKVSVGTSTNSLIPSEGKKYVRCVKSETDGKNQKGTGKGGSSKSEDKV